MEKIIKKINGKGNKLVIWAIGVIILSSLVYAVELPPGLLKIQEYNAGLAQKFMQNISFIIAFLAGITTMLSPCILPLLPAYFAITFKEKKRVTLSTLVFFLGFALIFMLMGLIAALTGKSLAMAFNGASWVIPAAGIVLVIFGIMMIFGKGFAGFAAKRRLRNDTIGVFLSGIFFAVGWTACTGPILSGVLIMSSMANNYFTASSLLLAYSLGIFVPLFLLSFFYDKIGLDKLNWLNKEKIIKIAGKEFHTSTPNIIAGTLFILLGLTFIIFKGTGLVFNSFQMFGLRQFFYSWQNGFIENFKFFNIIGTVVFLAFIALLAYFVVKEIKSKN